MDLDLAYLLIPLSFFTSMLTVVLGIGGGTLMLLSMTVLLPPSQIIFVHGLVQLASNSSRAGLYRRTVDWPSVRIFTVTSIMGVGLGGLLSVQLAPEHFRILVALFILSTLIFSVKTISPKGWMIGGMVSSFLTMFVGATGPLVAAMVGANEEDRDQMIGTLATMMVVQHGLKIALLLLAADYVKVDYLMVALIALFGLAGTYAGKKIGHHIPSHRFKRVFKSVLFLIASSILIRAIWALLPVTA